MSLRTRIDRLTQAAGCDNRVSSAPPYDVAKLRRLSPDELLRLHRAALATGADVPAARLVDELRRLPAEELIRQHRVALGSAENAE
jgi:hypothetical protein